MTEPNNYVGSDADLKFPQISNAHRGESAGAAKANNMARNESFNSQRG